MHFSRDSFRHRVDLAIQKGLEGSGISPKNALNLDLIDSITSMFILKELEDEFNLVIEIDDFAKLKSIDDLYKYLENRIKK